MALVINEIFHSIQGESLHAGRPCVFVRLTGCNLRCHYCDTRYAYDEGASRSLQSILSSIESFGCPLVEITGGEPLIQNDTPNLVRMLLDSGYEVLMETNGSMDIDRVDRRCSRIVDMKCPSSGEEHKNDYDNLSRLTPRDQIKFVILNNEDYVFAKHIVNEKRPSIPPANVLLSPVTGALDPSALAQWMIEDNLALRLHLQLHKIIWPEKDRGV